MFAGLLAAGGQAEEAARLWGAAAGVLERIAASVSPNVRLIRNRYIERVTASLGEARFETAYAEGRAMPLGHAIALARLQSDLLG